MSKVSFSSFILPAAEKTSQDLWIFATMLLSCIPKGEIHPGMVKNIFFLFLYTWHMVLLCSLHQPGTSHVAQALVKFAILLTQCFMLQELEYEPSHLAYIQLNCLFLSIFLLQVILSYLIIFLVCFLSFINLNISCE